MSESTVIRGEPDPASATLSEWIAYRDKLRALPQRDENVRLALAVAQAQIVKHQANRSVQRHGSAE